MTVIQVIACDAPGCEERTLTHVLPDNWGIVVLPNEDPFKVRSSSVHFCPTHIDGAEHLAAMRARQE